MNVIRTRNAHQALPEMMYRMSVLGENRESRNGPVRRLPGPTTIEFERPEERVLFWPQRDANPFFHLLESLWMLAGHDDVAFPASIVKRMADYSDDGKTFNAAYGKRWRGWFAPNPPHRTEPARDQLAEISHALRKNPDCRRQVLAIWDGSHDLGLNSKDLPCNTHVYFARNSSGDLDMTVCNRSNDAVWGALGSNVVHFSLLQEYVAGMIGCGVGKYWQVSNNMHLYLDQHAGLMEDMWMRVRDVDIPRQESETNPYHSFVQKTPLLQDSETIENLDRDMAKILDRRIERETFESKFCAEVAAPMLAASDRMKVKDETRIPDTLRLLDQMPRDSDWRVACEQWVLRRNR